MDKFVESGINQLKTLRRKNITDKTTQATKKRIDQIIQLYKDRKIARVSTAERLIKGLTSTDKKMYDKTFNEFKSKIDEWKKAPTLSERLNEKKKQKAKAKEKKTFFVNFILYYYLRGNLKELSIKSKKAFTHQEVHYFRVRYDNNESATIQATEFIKVDKNERIFRWENADDIGDPKKQNSKYLDVMNLLRDDNEFDKVIKSLTMYYDNLGCIKILSVEELKGNGERMNILDENLTDATNVDTYHHYINTPLKLDAETIKKGIEKGHYIENVCWRNALMDFYSNTLMGEKRKKRLTIEKISEIIGRDDFTEKGASIKEMEKVFIEFNIQVRIYSLFNTLIYKYDPKKRDHNIKTFYAMVKNKHIYSLNHDLNSLQHKPIRDRHVVKAPTDYYINEKEQPPTYKMITDINDIIKIEVPKDVKEIYLVSRDNDLTGLYFSLLNSGYDAGVRHQAGIITDLRLRMNKVKYIIKTQNLIKSSADGCIAVDDEDVYNKMNLAMYNFNKSLFNPFHKSYYSELDIKILNESRTVVPNGLLYQFKDIPKAITEIDITRAFTNPFINIYKIMEFCQFDKWNVYDETVVYDRLNDYTLLYLEKSFFKTSGMILFNKKYPVIYKAVYDKIKDERLKRRTKILAYKIPCKNHNVNYRDIHNQLMNTKISDNPEEDKLIKKLIGVVNYGLLEKGGSTDSKSFAFKHLDEALEYQAEY